jgi:hypothetical protein
VPHSIVVRVERRHDLFEILLPLLFPAGNQPVSVETTIARLKGFFAGAMEETLLGITAKRAAELKEPTTFVQPGSGRLDHPSRGPRPRIQSVDRRDE